MWYIHYQNRIDDSLWIAFVMWYTSDMESIRSVINNDIH